jgi:hypothetical protein
LAEFKTLDNLRVAEAFAQALAEIRALTGWLVLQGCPCEEKVMLTGNTAAFRLSPETPAPHPIALLAHGATGSKKKLFRFGEALAAAGFDWY